MSTAESAVNVAKAIIILFPNALAFQATTRKLHKICLINRLIN